MQNTRPLFKRALAYILDLFIVLTISSLVSSIPLLNKEINKYQEIYKEYETEYNSYMDTINLLNESYQDNILTQEEYDKFNESKYQKIIAEKYDDMDLSKEEHKQIIKKINDEFNKVAQDYIYLLNKNSTTNTVITLICTLLYFGLLQYLLKGQTVGKKILKLQVVSATDKDLNVFNYLLRTLIINNVLLNTVGTLFLIFASQKLYTQANSIIETLISIVEAIIIFTVITRQDSRGLHDLLFGTKVISTEEVKTEIKEENIIEIKEKTKTNITTKSKRKSNNNKKTNKKVLEAEYKDKK